MLMLEEANRIIADLLTASFIKPTSLDQKFVDFDSIRYHLSTPPKAKSPLLLSMHVRCWDELVAYGVDEIMRREYGQYLTEGEPVEDGYSVSLKIDVEGADVPALGELRDQVIKSLSLLKRNALAAPFEHAFARQKYLEANPPSENAAPVKSEVMSVHYRPEEAIYLLPTPDRVTLIFSTIFREETDRIFGKVFLQEFVDARRRPSCQTAPQVMYSTREAPLEIRSLQEVVDGGEEGNVGYVTFVLFPRHFSSPETASHTITHMQLFRDYLHYQLKAAKSYMHSRMRARTSEFLKMLNRAKPEISVGGGEKGGKTASGRTFIRS